MLEGKCPKCGFHCVGWALRNPEHQICPECGAKLEIAEGGRANDAPDEEEKIEKPIDHPQKPPRF